MFVQQVHLTMIFSFGSDSCEVFALVLESLWIGPLKAALLPQARGAFRTSAWVQARAMYV